MRKLLAGLLLLGTLACRTAGHPDDAQAMESGLQVGALRGFAATEMMIKSRLTLPNIHVFNLAQFLNASSGDGITLLLGGYQGNAGSSTLRNATPNAVNMMLWRIALSGAAAKIANQACNQDAYGLKPHFVTAAAKLCTPPEDPAVRVAALKEIWLATMRYDAPKAEMDAWLASPTTASADLKGVLESIFLDPYFLIAH